MPKTNLFDRVFFRMLFTLSAQRRSDFAAYISLNQFNPNSRLAELLHVILEQADKLNRSEVSLDSLGKACGMASTTVEKSISLLLSLLHDFMLVHASLQHKEQIQMLPFEAWIAEDLEDDLLEREYRRRLRQLHRQPVSDTNLHEELLLEHSLAQLKVGKPRKDQASLFDRHLGLLESYYSVTRLKYACAAVNATRIFGKAEVEQYLTFPPAFADDQMIPIARAYHCVLALLSNASPAIEDIGNALAFLNEHASRFSIDDQSDLYGYLLNTGFRGMATGAAEYDDLVHEVYQALIGNGLLISNGTMSGTHFKNIATVKVRTGRMEEARRFVEDNKKKLRKEDRELLAPYCIGLIEFHSGRLRAAIREFATLLHIAPDDLFWGLEARSMLWKAYYEGYELLNPDEHEEMLRLYHSFRTFVARSQQLSEYHRTGYTNFIRIFNRLINLTEAGDRAMNPEKLTDLLERAEGMELMANKKWILAKIQHKIAAKSDLSQ